MTTRAGISGGSAFTKAAAVLGVLAGIVTMHGLTGHHDAGMAMPHLSAASVLAHGPVGHHHAPAGEPRL